MSEYSTIELDVSRAGVAVVLLNRPDMTNAFNAQVVQELDDVFSMLSKSPEARVVILRGAGESFSTGEDLTWLKAADDFSEREFEEDTQALGDMLRCFWNLSQPTIALVTGEVRGPAMGLVAASDIVIAKKGASFACDEVRKGQVPSVIAPYIVEAIGPRWARALFVTGETFDGDYAERMGLVQYNAADETEMGQLEEMVVASIFEAGPRAVVEAKAVVNQVYGMEVDASLTKSTAHRAARQRVTEEGHEGAMALLEGRKPNWPR